MIQKIPGEVLPEPVLSLPAVWKSTLCSQDFGIVFPLVIVFIDFRDILDQLSSLLWVVDPFTFP